MPTIERWQYVRSRILCLTLAVTVMIHGVESARAADFNFDWSGTLGGQTVVVDALLTASFNAGTTYDVTSVSGTVTTGGIIENIIVGLGPTSVGSLTSRQQFLTSGGVGPSGHYLASTGSSFGGFTFSTSTHDYGTFGGVTDGLARWDTGTNLGNVTENLSAPHSITQVPGLVAGTGLLSYLLIAMVGAWWRGRILLNAGRSWLNKFRSGRAAGGTNQPAISSEVAA